MYFLWVRVIFHVVFELKSQTFFFDYRNALINKLKVIAFFESVFHCDAKTMC